MSRTNENKLKMKDIATIGIFSALLFVVTMVAGALMGISMVLNMYSVAVVAVLSAPLYMLIMAKVHKKGAVLFSCTKVQLPKPYLTNKDELSYASIFRQEVYLTRHDTAGKIHFYK